MPLTQPITRPAIRYYGSKWKLTPWIMSHVPQHMLFVDLFCGSASVILRKPPSPREVLNDRDEVVINFFTVLRTRPDELLHVLNLTPFARREYERSYEPADDPLESARRFFVRSWQGRGGPRAKSPSNGSDRRTGWRFQRTDASTKSNVYEWGNIDHLLACAERLREVQIECAPWEEIVHRYDHPGALFYADPPYPSSTRSGRWGNASYAFEFSEEDHARLAHTLNRIRGRALVSSYQSSLYDSLYAGWTKSTRTVRVDIPETRTEVLWLSPNGK